LNADLLKPRHRYLYRKMVASLKLNEIRSVIKMGNFNHIFSQGWPRKFCNETFYKWLEIFNTNAKIYRLGLAENT
jgi:hypothetical protein